MMELWGMQSPSLLPSLPGLLWPGVVVTVRVLLHSLSDKYPLERYELPYPPLLSQLGL